MKWLLLILFSTSLLIAHCQLPIKNQWTLEQCIDSALQNNKAIQMSGINVNKAEITLKATNFNFMPTVNGGATHGYNFGQTIDPFTNTFANSRVQYNNFYLNSSVTLFGGLEKYHAKKIAEVDYQSQQYNLEIERRNKSIDVTLAFLKAKLNSEIAEVAKQQRSLTQSQKERTEELVNAERITNSDLLKIEAQLAKDSYTLTKANNELKSSLLQLQQLIGIDYNTSFVLANKQVAKVSQDGSNSGNSTPLEAKISQLNIEKQLLESKRTKSQLSPSFVLNGSVGSGYSENNKFVDPNGEFIPKPFGDQLNENFYQSVSATLSIPIFNGYKTSSQIKINKLELERVRVEGEQSLLEYDNRVQQFKMNVSNAISLYESAKQLQVSSKLEFENSQIKYDNGVINFVEFMESKDAFFKAESEMIQAKYQLEFSRLVLGWFE